MAEARKLRVVFQRIRVHLRLVICANPVDSVINLEMDREIPRVPVVFDSDRPPPCRHVLIARGYLLLSFGNLPQAHLPNFSHRQQPQILHETIYQLRQLFIRKGSPLGLLSSFVIRISPRG